MLSGTKRASANVETTMNRRQFLSSVVVVPTLGALVAACGDDSTSNDSTNGSNGSNGTSSIAHPTGADDVVIRLGYEGGFVPRGFMFTNVPTLLVSGGGTAIFPGPFPELYPGPLLPVLNQRSINEAGIQRLLELANDAGLLAPPPDYSANIMVADVPQTVLIINANGTTYEHRADALGMNVDENGNSIPEQTVQREKLDAFVKLVSFLDDGIVGDGNLGTEGPWVAADYRFQATVATDEDFAATEGAVEVAWPSAAESKLAAASECARASASTVGETLAAAKQNTFFTEGATRYTVAAIGVLPGDLGC